MKKLLFIMMALVAAQSVQAEESKIDRAKRYGWKTAKVAFHVGEVFVGGCGFGHATFNPQAFHYGSPVCFGKMFTLGFSRELDANLVNGINQVTGFAVMAHGAYGLAKELGVLAGIKAGYKKIKEQKKIKLKQA